MVRKKVGRKSKAELAEIAAREQAAGTDAASDTEDGGSSVTVQALSSGMVVLDGEEDLDEPEQM